MPTKPATTEQAAPPTVEKHEDGTQTLTVPVHDPRTGAATVELRIKAGDLSWKALQVIAETLAHATSPATLVFQPATPPPLFVTIAEAGHYLRVEVRYVRALIDEGHLLGVECPQMTGDPELPEVSDESPRMPEAWKDTPPDDGPQFKRSHMLVPFADLVRFGERAIKDGSLPPVRKGHATRGFAPAPATTSTWSLVQEVLLTAPEGELLGVPDIAERVRDLVVSRGIDDPDRVIDSLTKVRGVLKRFMNLGRVVSTGTTRQAFYQWARDTTEVRRVYGTTPARWGANR